MQHGESEMNDYGRIGGDSDLSPHGQEVCFCHLIIVGYTEYKCVKWVNLLCTWIAYVPESLGKNFGVTSQVHNVLAWVFAADLKLYLTKTVISYCQYQSCFEIYALSTCNNYTNRFIWLFISWWFKRIKHSDINSELVFSHTSHRQKRFLGYPVALLLLFFFLILGDKVAAACVLLRPCYHVYADAVVLLCVTRLLPAFGSCYFLA